MLYEWNRYFMKCVLATHDAVIQTVTQIPQYICEEIKRNTLDEVSSSDIIEIEVASE